MARLSEERDREVARVREEEHEARQRLAEEHAAEVARRGEEESSVEAPPIAAHCSVVPQYNTLQRYATAPILVRVPYCTILH